MSIAAPPMSTNQIIATWRKKHPEALVCVSCGRLICTERHRYKSLTDEQAAAYVCAECKSDKAEAARAFEKMRGQPRRSTAAQLDAATAYCTWCRRWFQGQGQACADCQETHGGGWVLPGEIPLPCCGRCLGSHGPGECGYDEAEAAAVYASRQAPQRGPWIDPSVPKSVHPVSEDPLQKSTIFVSSKSATSNTVSGGRAGLSGRPRIGDRKIAPARGSRSHRTLNEIPRSTRPTGSPTANVA